MLYSKLTFSREEKEEEFIKSKDSKYLYLINQQLSAVNTLNKVNIHIHLILNKSLNYTSFYTYKCLNNSQQCILNTIHNYYSVNTETVLLKERNYY